MNTPRPPRQPRDAFDVWLQLFNELVVEPLTELIRAFGRFVSGDARDRTSARRRHHRRRRGSRQ